METDAKRNARNERLVPLQHPLVSSLVQRAEARGDTLLTLAKALGVSYERFTQWRRGEANIGNAKRKVHVAAASYLGVPPILVLGLCGKFEFIDFVVPSGEPMSERLEREIARINRHQLFGGFVPPELNEAKDSIKVLVIFLIRQLEARSETGAHWLKVMQMITNAKYEGAVGNDVAKDYGDGGNLFL